MKDFTGIYKAYYDSNDFFARKERLARTRNSTDLWARKKQINDYAYFVLLFAQLEDYINEQCTKLINKKLTLGSWKNRRLWDEITVDRMHFMRRVALLTEKGHTLYNKADKYYRLRCEIAHGDSSPGKLIHIPTVITDLKNLKTNLKG